MRKFRYILGTCIVGISALVTSAFAYFNFSSNSSTDSNANTNSEYVNNIKFDNNSTKDSDRTYTLYFFASPYYATGLESDTISSTTNAIKDLTDPLEIVTSNENPYISEDSYCITSYTALTGDDVNYSNYVDSSSNYRYISTPSYDPSDVSYDGSKLNKVTNTYTKADFCGTVEADNEALEYGTYDEDNNSHTYFKVTVTDSIKNDVLKNITAKTVFKNRYGFSPEFMGWTYDKQTCFDRVTFATWSKTYQRYYTNSILGVYNDLKMISVTTDSDGNVSLNYDDPKQIGNYGANSNISLLSSDDSLYGIDNNALDGSESNDKIIYLYPVFGDRTISTSTSVIKAPILKMLSNPDTDKNSYTYYKYHQEGENDYSIDTKSYTYTTPRKATFLNYDSSVSVSSGTTVTKPNYTLKNFYVDQTFKNDDGSFMNNYYLEVLTVNGDSYSSSWSELFNNSRLIDLFNITDTTKKTYFENYVNNYEGTFDIDIIFSQEKFSFSAFENDELYINNPTLKEKTFTNDDGTSITVYYVIGLKRNNSLKLITSDSQGVLNYSSRKSNYFTKTNFTYEESKKSSYWHYFTCNPFTVTLTTDDEKANGKLLSVMFKESLTFCVNSSGAYTKDFSNITSGVLSSFNNYVSESNLKNKVKFLTANSKNEITASTSTVTATDGSSATTTNVSNFPTIRVKKSGTYEILAAVKYSDGFPSDIQIGFREYSEVCNLLILSEKPTNAIDSSGNYLYSNITTNYSDKILLEDEFSLGSTITRDTKFGSTKFSSILDENSTKVLRDLATGKEISLDLIKNGNFVLSRNMILYYSDD